MQLGRCREHLWSYQTDSHFAVKQLYRVDSLGQTRILEDRANPIETSSEQRKIRTPASILVDEQHFLMDVVLSAYETISNIPGFFFDSFELVNFAAVVFALSPENY